MRNNLLKNIKQKYRNKNQSDENKNFDIISNTNNYSSQKNDYKDNDKIKKQSINNYIYNNLRKINENRFSQKNIKLKCSVLSNEASQIIRDFNKKQKEREQIINIGNINYYNYIPIASVNKNNNIGNDNYEYIDMDDDNQNFLCDYNDVSNYKNVKIKIIPNKIAKNRKNILNNNFYKAMNYPKGKNNYNCYRKIKHNTSKNQYNNN